MKIAGMEMIREASIKTEKDVKNASSTAVLLARGILQSAVKKLPNDTINIGSMTPTEVSVKIAEEYQVVAEKLVEMSKPIKDLEELTDVVCVATKERDLGPLIAEAQMKLGVEGILVAEETLLKECSVEYVKGIVLDNGLASTNVINNVEKGCLEAKDCPVILTNYILNDLDKFKEIREMVKELVLEGHKHIILMGRAFSDKSVQQCQEYHQAVGVGLFPVNAPFQDQKEIMRDMQAVLGGTFMNVEERTADTITRQDVGFAENVTIDLYRAVIAGRSDEDTSTRVETRTAQLEERKGGAISAFEKENIEKRLAQLRTGFAIIKVGALTDSRRKTLKDKADDAVGTARMALMEGTVKGGGLAFKEIADTLPDDYIIKPALYVLHKHIVESAPKHFIVEDWVKDPTRTLRVALQYACEVAADVATVGIVIRTVKEKPRLVQEVATPSEEENNA